jgi:hypothetical protein
MESTYSDPALLAYSDARTEYTRQLCQFVVPATFKFFMKLLDKARVDVGSETQKTLYQFQTYLKDIPEWNMEKVTNEVRLLESDIGCEYLEDLLTAVFIAHTKILTAIRVSSKKNANVQINVPKVERFIFKVLCEMSQLYWKNTYLFRDDVKNLDKQQNYRQAEGMVAEGISMAIRALVPVKNILRECVVLNENNQVEADTDSDTEESASAVAVAAAADVPVVAASAEAAKDMSNHPVVQALLTAPETPVQTGGSAEPILTIDESVGFAEYDTVFDGDKSNMLFDPKDKDLQSPSGLLEILDEPATSLGDDDIISEDAPAMDLGADDFEELAV